ncbi:hypothetical protein, partial [Klebsiella variicola]|uniref:hypothetical protein n=1 Tax=Klebsiella variicola TaxID=244366 RepID=UPI001CA3298C
VVNRSDKYLQSCTLLLYNIHVQKKSHQALLKVFVRSAPGVGAGASSGLQTGEANDAGLR